MSNILTFKSECPGLETSPLLYIGVAGIFFVSFLPYFLTINTAKDTEVLTISHTARQESAMFSFAAYIIGIILFLAQCVYSGALISLFLIALILLFIIFACNPEPERNSRKDQILRMVHKYTALILFVYILVLSWLSVIIPIQGFDSSSDAVTSTFRKIADLLVIFQTLCMFGMLYIQGFLNAFEKERWTPTNSYLERLFVNLFFIIIAMIPSGTLA